MGRTKAVFWTRAKIKAAGELALGYLYKEVAESVGVSERTIKRWMKKPEFRERVVELSLETGVACKAYRLQLINRAIRQDVNEYGIKTSKDVLEWIKEARLETEGLSVDVKSGGKPLKTNIIVVREIIDDD